MRLAAAALAIFAATAAVAEDSPSTKAALRATDCSFIAAKTIGADRTLGDGEVLGLAFDACAAEWDEFVLLAADISGMSGIERARRLIAWHDSSRESFIAQWQQAISTIRKSPAPK